MNVNSLKKKQLNIAISESASSPVQQKHCISIRAFTAMLSTQVNCHEIYTTWFPRRVLTSIQTTFENRVVMCCLLEAESSIFTQNCKRR